MILGMTLFTAVHVLLSLIGILSGLIVLYGLCTANPMNAWTLLFLKMCIRDRYRAGRCDRFYLHPASACPD